MDVIGDNIANLNTVGYKGSRASFADLLPNHVTGMNGVATIGSGAGTKDVNTLFGQGTLEGTGNALDAAINGGGFFVVSNGDESLYTRAGEFYMDENGYVVTGGGFRLQGYTAQDGVVGKTIGDLQIGTAPVPPSPSSYISIEANLDSSSEFDTTPLADGDFVMDGTSATVNEVASAGDFTTSVTVYDSLGEAHEVTVVYEKTGENSWDWYAVVDAGELNGGFDDGNAFEISSGSLSFDSNGNMTGFSQNNENDSGNSWNFSGAEQTDFAFNFGIDSNGDTVAGGITQNAGESSINGVSQDGYASGTLTGIQMGVDGTIEGTYTNGQVLDLGQVVLADFASDTGLERIGGSMYQATAASGEAAVGAPGSGGRGDVYGAALETSNVDLESEFVHMITAQRTYQANSRVFSSSNDLLQELVNLV